MNIRIFSKPDATETLCTAVIQQAIDRVSAAGGGRVTVEAGVYGTGMLRLKDNVDLHLERGAVLKASGRVEDHLPLVESAGSGDYWRQGGGSFHLLVAQGCRNVALTGSGRLDGNGTAWYDPVDPGTDWPRPRDADWRRMGALVLFTECSDVTIQGVQLGNVCNWTLHVHECDDVRIRDIRIVNPPQAPNSDGIDITGCRDVTVTGAHIDTGDDAICLKTLPGGRSCENVVVSQCVLRTHCVALKLGATESFQDMRNVVFSDCAVSGSHRVLGIYSLEGAVIEHVLCRNITFDTRTPLMFPRPLHVDLRGHREASKVGAIRNIQICGFSGESNGRSLLTAQPGTMLEDLLISDFFLRVPAFDDPARHGAEFGGAQFSNRSPRARTERAAFVFENARGVDMERIRVRWPEDGAEIPEGWRFERKLANGTHRVFVPEDWALDADTPVHAVSAHNVHGGHLDTTALRGWQGGSAAFLEASDWNLTTYY
ncbi:MAG: hypothetical protein JJU05_13685 [Verrucomicrobia bacterium]|nr:hypothetical protein [Verrucomicrobiota bacterium]MCH8528195.1 hypothetical protein [Kiritimatiellia bacterium]